MCKGQEKTPEWAFNFTDVKSIPKKTKTSGLYKNFKIELML